MKVKQYKELEQIANRIEEIRIELYNSLEHRENMIDDEGLEETNDQLFSLQSDIHSLVDIFEMCS